MHQRNTKYNTVKDKEPRLRLHRKAKKTRGKKSYKSINFNWKYRTEEPLDILYVCKCTFLFEVLFSSY